MKITTRLASTVHPAARAPAQLLPLSACDRFIRSRNVPIIFFFAAHEDGSPALPSTQLLCDSLSKLLVYFYPFAGRLRRNVDNNDLELLCNDAGVEFVEAFVDGTLQDFGIFSPLSSQTIHLVEPTASYILAESDFHDNCLLYVQITRFTCGAAAFVVTLNHKVADGMSISLFLSSWAEIARGKEVSSPPCHDRTLLRAARHLDPGFRPLEIRIAKELHDTPLKTSLSAWPEQRLFTFSSEELRNKSAVTTSPGFPLSTFEVFSAHIWRSITKARGLDWGKTTKLLTPLDARKRLNPPLPEGFFGNAIFLVHVSARVRDIMQESLPATAARIHKALSEFTGDYGQAVLAWAEQQKGKRLEMNLNSGQDVRVTNWRQLAFEKLEFGSAGKPICVRPGGVQDEGAACVVPSHKGDGFLDVFISLHPRHMQLLETDAEFLLRQHESSSLLSKM